MIPEPSDEIRLGRRMLESIPEYALKEDLRFDREVNRWVLKFSLIGRYTPSLDIPQTTVWHCFISNEYPFGSLEIFPDSIDGVTATFHHMSYNQDVGKPWRSGNICVKTNLGGWGRNMFNSEPFTASERLYWNILRALAWLAAAAENKLANDGDPYEFPDIPKASLLTVVFNETRDGIHAWDEMTDVYGVFDYFIPTFNSKVIVVESFFGKKVGLQYEWGRAISQSTKYKKGRGYWVRITSAPVLHPWKIPMTWSELFDACQDQGTNLKKILNHGMASNRFFDDVSYIAIGFPVSQFVNDGDKRMHWLMFEMPTLKQEIRGFKKYSVEYYRAKLEHVFRSQNKLRWINSENWAKDQLTARGRVIDGFDQLKFCVVGAGALGSIFCDILARLGCENFTLIDPDGVATGNFSRHTLDMRSTSLPKASEVANKLNFVFPFIQATSKSNKLEWVMQANGALRDEFDVFIDATGNDTVLAALTQKVGDPDKLIVSLSINADASKLYCFVGRPSDSDLFVLFDKLMGPWHKKQQDENPNPTFTLENIGCWHPVFPARLDDILSMLAPTIRLIEKSAMTKEVATLNVAERLPNGNIQITTSSSDGI